MHFNMVQITIFMTEEVKKQLEELKIIEQEPLYAVIQRLLDFYKENKKV